MNNLPKATPTATDTPEKGDILYPPHAKEPWYNVTKDKIYELSYCKYITAVQPLVYVEGAFYNYDGVVEEQYIRQMIALTLRQANVQRGFAKRTAALLDALRLYAFSFDALDDNSIDVENGCLTIDYQHNCAVFLETKGFSHHRFSINYDYEQKAPEIWTQFLSELLEPADILTLQEYLGYCLIDSTKAQSMLFIIGKGGEGKSQIGRVISKLFGDCAYFGSINELTEDKFLKANLVGKRVLVDDDMNFSALRDTSFLKSLASSETPLMVQEKGKQGVQVRLKCRTICFSNAAPKSLYDKSYGWTRRLIILNTKPVPEGRVSDPFFGDKLTGSYNLAGIFNWALEGLMRLLEQNYRFTIGDKARAASAELAAENCNVITFLADEQIVEFGEGLRATTSELYQAYTVWCSMNALKALKQDTFSQWISANAEQYNIVYNKHVWNKAKNTRARGFVGVGTRLAL